MFLVQVRVDVCVCVTLQKSNKAGFGCEHVSIGDVVVVGVSLKFLGCTIYTEKTTNQANHMIISIDIFWRLQHVETPPDVYPKSPGCSVKPRGVWQGG